MLIVDKNRSVPNTLAIPSVAPYVAHIVDSRDDLVGASEQAKKLSVPLLPLGEGSNIVPRDVVNAFVVIMNNKGIEQNENYLTVQAGEKWDDIVNFAVQTGLSGI